MSKCKSCQVNWPDDGSHLAAGYCRRCKPDRFIIHEDGSQSVKPPAAKEPPMSSILPNTPLTLHRARMLEAYRARRAQQPLSIKGKLTLMGRNAMQEFLAGYCLGLSHAGVPDGEVPTATTFLAFARDPDDAMSLTPTGGLTDESRQLLQHLANHRAIQESPK